jgi:hypothetical protein
MFLSDDLIRMVLGRLRSDGVKPVFVRCDCGAIGLSGSHDANECIKCGATIPSIPTLKAEAKKRGIICKTGIMKAV